MDKVSWEKRQELEAEARMLGFAAWLPDWCRPNWDADAAWYVCAIHRAPYRGGACLEAQCTASSGPYATREEALADRA